MYNALVITAIVAFAAWLALHARTRRPDGDLLSVHPYRRLMFYIMPTRTESQVYFERLIDARPLLAYLDEARTRFGANVTHAAVAASAAGLASTPRMNRFVAGRRLYQRRGTFVTFSMKRKAEAGRIDRNAKIATVKLEMRDGETFRQLCERVNGDIRLQRSGKKTHADKEFQLFNLLPRPVLWAAARALRQLDHFGLLPGFFIRDDPMYTSMFVANLGSLKMDAGFHHLYEYGSCPIFLMLGEVEERPMVVDGRVEAIPVLPLRFTYDERIDDGLNARFGMKSVVRVLSDPARWLGCLDADEAQHPPLWPRPDWAAEDGEFAARD